MPCRKRVCRSYGPGSIREVNSLSYGLDSEDDEALEKNIFHFFTEKRQDNFSKPVWRLLLIDAWAVWKFRSFVQAIIIWSLFFLFLGITTVLIIGPSNRYTLSQQEILRLGAEEKDALNSSDIFKENEELREVALHNVLKNDSYTEKVSSTAKGDVLGNHSNQFPFTKENELYHQKSQLTYPSIIKFRRKNNMSVKETPVSLDHHKCNQNKEAIAGSQSTESPSDLTNKLIDLENVIHQLSTEIGRLQLDFMTKEQLPEDIKIRKIVHEEIFEVEKEKLGLPDFALETSGGSIIGTPNTKTYTTRTVVQLFGFPLWYVETSPRNAIQASVSPGECWTFHGSSGSLQIQLASPALVFGFSLYHIPKQISLSGDITSSPREFSVVGFHSSELNSEILLGEYEYNNNGTPLQTFPVQRDVTIHLSIVELRIHSNYGHPEFTCLYRFQVHGRFSVSNH